MFQGIVDIAYIVHAMFTQWMMALAPPTYFQLINTYFYPKYFYMYIYYFLYAQIFGVNVVALQRFLAVCRPTWHVTQARFLFLGD